jgi:hypothetical protein
MQKSDWYRDRAAESDRKAHATTKPATRDRHIKDRDGWLEIAASIDASDVNRVQAKSAPLCQRPHDYHLQDDDSGGLLSIKELLLARLRVAPVFLRATLRAWRIALISPGRVHTYI